MSGEVRVSSPVPAEAERGGAFKAAAEEMRREARRQHGAVVRSDGLRQRRHAYARDRANEMADVFDLWAEQSAAAVVSSPATPETCDNCDLTYHPGLTCGEEGAVEDLLSDAAGIGFSMSREAATSRVLSQRDPASPATPTGEGERA